MKSHFKARVEQWWFSILRPALLITLALVPFSSSRAAEYWDQGFLIGTLHFQHPFTPEHAQKLKNMGINTLVLLELDADHNVVDSANLDVLEDAVGFNVIVVPAGIFNQWVPPVTRTYARNQLDIYRTAPGADQIIGWGVCDEPQTEHFDWVASAFQAIEAVDNRPAVCTSSPPYAPPSLFGTDPVVSNWNNYLALYDSKVQPSHIMFNNYPGPGSTAWPTAYEDSLQGMEHVADNLADPTGRPFHNCVQGWDTPKFTTTPGKLCYIPSVAMSLAIDGFFWYFNYFPSIGTGLTNADGNPTWIGNVATSVNRKAAQLGQALGSAYRQQTVHTPSNTTTIIQGGGKSHIVRSTQDALFGQFFRQDGSEVLVATNLHASLSNRITIDAQNTTVAPGDFIWKDYGNQNTVVFGKTSRVITHRHQRIYFHNGLPSSPVIIAAIESTYGGDTANVRMTHLNSTSVEIWCEEERSNIFPIDEVQHLPEVISYLATRDGWIRNDNGAIIGEAGLRSISQTSADYWLTVSLDRTYLKPVVFAQINTFYGSQPAHTRVKNVTATSFQVQVEEWWYLDGVHLTEQVSFVVLEEGNHTAFGGRQLEIGTVNISHESETRGDWRHIQFNHFFSVPPVTLTHVQTENGGHPVVTRQNLVSRSGFDVMLQEEEGLDRWHTTEKVGYLAVW